MKIALNVIVVFILSVTCVFAQEEKADTTDEKEILQFSGIVVEGDSMLGMPGVHVFVPNTGRGTSTNLVGYFSMPVEAGDSVVLGAIGYKKHHIIIPEDSSGMYSVVIEMDEDTTYLPEVHISSFPSERVFKEAILAMDIPDENISMNRNLNDKIMRRLLSSSEMDARMSTSFYMQQQASAIEDRYVVTSMELLNPFAWSRFFKDIKDQKEKNIERRKQEKSDSPY